MKWTFDIDVFILTLRLTLEVDFLNLCIYFQTLKQTFGIDVYLKYTSFQKKSRSINKVLLKYKQSTFSFFFCFYTFLYFFQEVHLQHASIGLQGTEV